MLIKRRLWATRDKGSGMVDFWTEKHKPKQGEWGIWSGSYNAIKVMTTKDFAKLSGFTLNPGCIELIEYTEGIKLIKEKKCK